MSFWQTDSRTPYGQKSISIVAENGKQFSPNSKITIVVSPDVAFFQPSESYLSLRVRVDNALLIPLHPLPPALPCPLLSALLSALPSALLSLSLSLCRETGRLRAGRRETNRRTCESIQMHILITDYCID